MVQNPFNGIERHRYVRGLRPRRHNGIHSMELKGIVLELFNEVVELRNPFNGIESV